MKPTGITTTEQTTAHYIFFLIKFQCLGIIVNNNMKKSWLDDMSIALPSVDIAVMKYNGMFLHLKSHQLFGESDS